MEKLTFKITLDCEYHPDFQKEPPKYNLKINNEIIQSGEITEETVIEFERDCPEKNTLSIEFLNKTKYDVELGDDGMPTKNKLIHIKEIEIDEINLNHLIHTLSEYYPTDPWYIDLPREDFPIPMRRCVDLGWNGEWKFKFDTPFYIFLLENL